MGRFQAAINEDLAIKVTARTMAMINKSLTRIINSSPMVHFIFVDDQIPCCCHSTCNWFIKVDSTILHSSQSTHYLSHWNIFSPFIIILLFWCRFLLLAEEYDHTEKNHLEKGKLKSQSQWGRRTKVSKRQKPRRRCHRKARLLPGGLSPWELSPFCRNASTLTLCNPPDPDLSPQLRLGRWRPGFSG